VKGSFCLRMFYFLLVFGATLQAICVVPMCDRRAELSVVLFSFL